MNTEVLEPAKATAKELAEQRLRAAILERRLLPGERVNEVALAEELGISRGPVREAIQMLASEGFLNLVRNRGAFVITVDPSEIKELYEVRIALERRAIKLVASQRDDQQIIELARMLDETAAALESGDVTAYPRDRDFHQAILNMCGNPTLIRFNAEVQARIQFARTRSASDPARATSALKEHLEILRAVLSGNGPMASDLMEAHLYRSLANVVASA